MRSQRFMHAQFRGRCSSARRADRASAAAAVIADRRRPEVGAAYALGCDDGDNDADTRRPEIISATILTVGW